MATQGNLRLRANYTASRGVVAGGSATLNSHHRLHGSASCTVTASAHYIEHITTGVARFLNSQSAITDLVSSRIYPIYPPQSVALPCLTYTLTSVERVMTHDGAAGLPKAYIDFDIYANSQDEILEIEQALIATCVPYEGLAGNVQVYGTKLTARYDVEEAPVHGEESFYYQHVVQVRWTYREIRPRLSLTNTTSVTDIEQSVVAYLLACPLVADFVGENIFPHNLPANTVEGGVTRRYRPELEPSIVYKRMSGGDDISHAGLITSSAPRFRLYAFSPTYKQVIELGERIRSSLDGLSGTIDDSRAYLIRVDEEEAVAYDYDGSQTKIYAMPLDYTVIYKSF